MQSYSQFGEDRRVFDYFQRRSEGFFVEVGAHDPERIPQTRLLEEHGWHGILVEPLPHLAARLREQRPGSRVFECAVAGPGSPNRAWLKVPAHSEAETELAFDKPTPDAPEVAVRTLDSILEEAGREMGHFPRIDFLSIDIEGMEIPALKAFDFNRFAPSLILIEDHVHDLHKHRFMQSHGYRLVDRTGCNAWYVPAGAPRPSPRAVSHWELLRKYYLALPLRQLKLAMKSSRT